jgi:hypothetical protein
MTECVHSITVTLPSGAIDSIGVTMPDRAIAITAGQQGPPGRDGDGSGELAYRRVLSSLTLLTSDAVLVDSGARVDLLLPSGNATDKTIRIACLSGRFRVTQQQGHQIRFNDNPTTLGTGGFIELIDAVGAVTLLGIAPGQWLVTACTGSFEVS